MFFVGNLKRSIFWGGLLAGVVAAGSAEALVVGPINLGGYRGPVEIQLNGFATQSNLNAGSNEITWAAGFITNIFEFGDTGNSFYSDSTPGIDRIGVLIYGVADGNTFPGGGGNFNIHALGCTGGDCDGKIHADFYLKSQPTTTSFGGAAGLKIANRTGFDDFTGITDGTPFMKWVFTPGLVTSDLAGGSDPTFDDTLTTLFQNVNALIPPAAGNGNFFAKCVSGPGCTAFDNNGYPNGADFFGQYNLSSNLTTGIVNNGWTGRISDPIRTAVLPEPSSMLVFGASLFGLGFASRRREKRT